MPRRTFADALPLFAVLAALTPGETPAGPPEGMSGRMVLDKVADGLRRYQRDQSPSGRMTWLKRLAPSKDPRVAIALAEESVGAAPTFGDDGRQYAAFLLIRHYIPEGQWLHGAKCTATALHWWKANGADLRRRAKQLPQ
jgi:hypothetical protein